MVISMAKDFRNKTFTKILRGYSPEEVDEYISYLYDEFVKSERREHEIQRKLALALKKLDEFNVENVRYDDSPEVKSAKKEADAIIKESVKVAENVIAEAEQQAESIKTSAMADADRLKKKAVELYGEVSSFRNSLFEMYGSHIEAVERIAEEAANFIDRTEKLAEETDAENEAYTDEAEDSADLSSADFYADGETPESDFSDVISGGLLKDFDVKSEDELSLTDEFNIVFSGSDTKKNIDAIRRQPTISAQAPDKNQNGTTVIKKIVKKNN